MHRAWQKPLFLVVAMALIVMAMVSLQVVGVRAAENQSPAAQPIGLFDGMKSGDLQVRYVPKNDREAQIIIKNNTRQPLSVKLPDAFAGVPVLAQVGGGARSGSSRGSSGGGGGQTSGGGGGGSRGGGGGVFNVAPEAVSKVKVPIVCLEHGKEDPNDHIPYEIRPIDSFTTDARVQELLKMLGTGEVDQRAAQAAAWHFTNKMSWNDLAAKKLNHIGAQPYFSKAEMQAGMAAAARSEQLARGRMEDDTGAKKAPDEMAAKPMSPGEAAEAVSPGDRPSAQP